MAPRPVAGPPRVTGASGTLRINSRPWSQVYVDGRLIGNTPQMNVPLSPGSHSLKLVNPQLGMSKTLKIKIQNGQVTTKIVELMEQ
jgi:serine/threonine-protein kinase